MSKPEEAAKYSFRPYESVYPGLFESEAERLSSYLTGEYRVEHIGSTAIPNLGGKGIIDLYIIAPQAALAKMTGELLEAGYERRPNAGDDQRIFFRLDLPDKDEHIRRYHIHLSHTEAADFRRAIAFRDYLREHPDEANRYAAIKQRAALEAHGDKDAYMAIKAPVIEDILQSLSRPSDLNR